MALNHIYDSSAGKVVWQVPNGSLCSYCYGEALNPPQNPLCNLQHFQYRFQLLFIKKGDIYLYNVLSSSCSQLR